MIKITIDKEGYVMEGGNNIEYMTHLASTLSSLFFEMRDSIPKNELEESNKRNLDRVVLTLLNGMKDIYSNEPKDGAIPSPYL